jgi:hypothetical protein
MMTRAIPRRCLLSPARKSGSSTRSRSSPRRRTLPAGRCSRVPCGWMMRR